MYDSYDITYIVLSQFDDDGDAVNMISRLLCIQAGSCKLHTLSETP